MGDQHKIYRLHFDPPQSLESEIDALPSVPKFVPKALPLPEIHAERMPEKAARANVVVTTKAEPKGQLGMSAPRQYVPDVVELPKSTDEGVQGTAPVSGAKCVQPIVNASCVPRNGETVAHAEKLHFESLTTLYGGTLLEDEDPGDRDDCFCVVALNPLGNYNCLICRHVSVCVHEALAHAARAHHQVAPFSHLQWRRFDYSAWHRNPDAAVYSDPQFSPAIALMASVLKKVLRVDERTPTAPPAEVERESDSTGSETDLDSDGDDDPTSSSEADPSDDEPIRPPDMTGWFSEPVASDDDSDSDDEEYLGNPYESIPEVRRRYMDSVDKQFYLYSGKNFNDRFPVYHSSCPPTEFVPDAPPIAKGWRAARFAEKPEVQKVYIFNTVGPDGSLAWYSRFFNSVLDHLPLVHRTETPVTNLRDPNQVSETLDLENFVKRGYRFGTKSGHRRPFRTNDTDGEILIGGYGYKGAEICEIFTELFEELHDPQRMLITRKAIDSTGKIISSLQDATRVAMTECPNWDIYARWPDICDNTMAHFCQKRIVANAKLNSRTPVESKPSNWLWAHSKMSRKRRSPIASGRIGVC
jgi:hypothetical protein